MNVKLGRFGHIKPTFEGNESTVQGRNTMTEWWVREDAYPFAGICAQEDHQFRKKWMWGYTLYFLGFILLLPIIALGHYLLIIPSIALSILGYCNIHGITKVRQNIEVEGQVVEAIVAYRHYGEDFDKYMEATVYQLDTRYRDKMFKGETTDDIRKQCRKAIPAAQKWVDANKSVIDVYLKSDPTRNANK